jgi:membrane protease subunit (stomatin/prohibitin family)
MFVFCFLNCFVSYYPIVDEFKDGTYQDIQYEITPSTILLAKLSKEFTDSDRDEKYFINDQNIIRTLLSKKLTDTFQCNYTYIEATKAIKTLYIQTMDKTMSNIPSWIVEVTKLRQEYDSDNATSTVTKNIIN